jgi:hypothetical protein
MINNGDDVVVVEIENFVGTKDKAFIIGRRFNHKTDLFTSPMSSSSLNIFKVSDRSSTLECWRFENVRCKVFNMPIPGIVSRAIFPISVDLV